jgi:hypothetical protein
VKVHGQWVTYDLDRGSVSAVSPASITLARPDGQSVTFSIGPSTRFRGVDSEAAIQVHQPALVISENGAALVIRQRPSGSGAGGAGAAAGGASTAA